MDDWMKILSAIFIVMMLVYLFPRAKQMFQDSKKATTKDWQSALIPLAMVVLFIVFLVMSVR
ncbi:MAG: hypothetical protein OEZ43_21110 [Gammaproteobacteria bacterium]|nr:hypothetical protein [Gammaproteobacteria bacterium]